MAIWKRLLKAIRDWPADETSRQDDRHQSGEVECYNSPADHPEATDGKNMNVEQKHGYPDADCYGVPHNVNGNKDLISSTTVRRMEMIYQNEKMSLHGQQSERLQG